MFFSGKALSLQPGRAFRVATSGSAGTLPAAPSKKLLWQQNGAHLRRGAPLAVLLSWPSSGAFCQVFNIFALEITSSPWFCRHRRENPRAPGTLLRKPSARTHFLEIAVFLLTPFEVRFSARRSGQSHFGSERCNSPRALEKCEFLKVMRFYTGGNGI